MVEAKIRRFEATLTTLAALMDDMSMNKSERQKHQEAVSFKRQKSRLDYKLQRARILDSLSDKQKEMVKTFPNQEKRVWPKLEKTDEPQPPPPLRGNGPQKTGEGEEVLLPDYDSDEPDSEPALGATPMHPMQGVNLESSTEPDPGSNLPEESKEQDAADQLPTQVSKLSEQLEEINQLEMGQKLKALQKICKRLTNAALAAARHDRLHRLAHAAHLSQISTITRIVNPKPREMPEGHPFITDAETGELRPCENTEEILTATQQHHGFWTGATKAKKHFFFGEIKEDQIGPCGIIETNVDRNMTQEDLKDYLRPDSASTPEQRQHYIEAHNGPLKELFRHRAPTHPAQHWPCRFDRDSGVLNDGGLINSYRKSIISVPGKARYEDFHLAVLGRMNHTWIENMEILLLASALLRYFPTPVKFHSRCPIPKEKAGETRPIAIGTDMFNLLSSVMGHWLMDVTEELQLYEKACVAYRRGQGCDDITHTLIGIREDAIEHNR